MSDLLGGNTMDYVVEDINKYNILCKTIETLEDEAIEKICENGFIKTGDLDIKGMRTALMYFISVICEEEDYVYYNYKKALNAYVRSKFKKDTYNYEGDYINEGSIHALYSNELFAKQLELEQLEETSQIAYELISEIKNDPGNKEILSSLNSLNKIIQNKKDLYVSKDKIILHSIPEDIWVVSYDMLLEVVDGLMTSMKRYNQAEYMKAYSKIKKDAYIKREKIDENYGYKNFGDD